MSKGAFTHTQGEVRRLRAVDVSARECKRVKICQARREAGEQAVPRGIACQIVQYVHSGTLHT